MYQGNFVRDGFKNVFYTTPAAGYEGMVFTQYFTEIVGTRRMTTMVDTMRQRIDPRAGICRG